MAAVSAADVHQAARTIAGTVLRTPTLPSPRLSALTGATVFVKYENLQATGSFKERGAFNKLAGLSERERRRGVVAMSAGNHAQAVAYLARKLGIAATIVMPNATPFVKVAVAESFGARVLLDGETIADAEQRAMRLADEGLVLVHPYDDPAVIAGQGTAALELLEDVPDLDVILVPIGGGGLIAGIAVAAKATRPAVEIIGVETALFPSMSNALRGENRPCEGATIAEGIAVKNVGRLTVPIVKELVADVVLVEEAQLERAVNAFLTQQKTLAEGAGAAGLAAILAAPDRFRGRRVGIVLSGGNIDPRVAASIMVRELEREDRIVSYRLSIQDRPGMLGSIATLIGRLGGNILQVEHRRLFLDMPARSARLDLTVETRDRKHAEAIERALVAEGYTVQRVDSGTGGLEPL